MTTVLPDTVVASVVSVSGDVSRCCLMSAFLGASMMMAACNQTIPTGKTSDPPTSLAAASCHVYRSTKGYIRYLSVVKELTEFAKFSFDEKDPCLIWPSLAVAANVVMEMHTDDDFIMGCAGVLGSRGHREHDPLGSDILQYFCFPATGTAVGLRNGDLLLFNPRTPHCVSS